MATTMLQKFWDSALALEPAEDESDSRRQACPHILKSLH